MRQGGVRAEVGFIAPVEGLRGVAVLLVVVFHYFVLLDARFADPWIAAADAWLPAKVVARNGMIGVDLFFLITGFLLVLPWLRNEAAGGAAPSAAAFYRRRMRRILPAYYVHLLALFLVALPLLRGLEFWRYNTVHVLENLSAHILLVHYFTPATSGALSVNGALWSLALEAQFYLLLPLLAPVFARAPVRTAAVLVALALAWRWLAAHHLDAWVAWMRAIEPRWNVTEAGARHLLATQLPGYLAHFAAGMLAALAWLRSRQAAPSWKRGAVATGALAVLGALHAPGGWVLGEWTWIVALAALAAVFTTAVVRPGPVASRLLSAAPLAFAGRVSYSAYLYHVPLLLLVNAWAPEVTGSSPLVLPAYLAAVAAVAWLSYRYVELAWRPGDSVRVPTRNAAAMASPCRAATPQSTCGKRPASMSSPKTTGAMASPVSMPE